MCFPIGVLIGSQHKILLSFGGPVVLSLQTASDQSFSFFHFLVVLIGLLLAKRRNLPPKPKPNQIKRETSLWSQIKLSLDLWPYHFQVVELEASPLFFPDSVSFLKQFK
jgi:hypothetical protein